MSSITVTQLKYLKAVAESGGFLKAAERINVSQPALTRQIQALEAECQTRLLRRTTRGVLVTEEGQALLDAAQAVFDSLHYAQNVAKSFARKTLRVRSVSTPKLAEYVRLCRDKLERLEIDVSIATYDQVLASLSVGECDVGFLTMPEQEAGFHAIEICRYPFCAYVPPDHIWAQRKVISISELTGQQIIVSPRSRRSRQVFDDYLQDFGVQVGARLELGSTETIWNLAQEGMGIGVLSCTGAATVESLVRLDFSENITIPLHLVALPKEKRSRITNAAVAIGERYLQPNQVSQVVGNRTNFP
ncbi:MULTISPECIES: LysR family transcriptional regulator [Rhizobium/Agrobacterium group]|uniref:HTH-type transcriptional regulator TtuA n=1 Tax=Agrobacterium larrymoorei TaxID=160699 RepID=A0AAF0HGB7_9HYPH|nr:MULTISPECIES: LysR family transcriptional regulator [Rhizobium/Agrobacterium group]NTH23292.1 LysR family transcriptional regulator [Rhizobium rhizogenes]NTH36330.1 LysR family transcriptional regulator [Rhizobium rhizogenes]WHA44280.1 LysR family transcriptional regulator [Agrobacterium larrymoorei]